MTTATQLDQLCINTLRTLSIDRAAGAVRASRYAHGRRADGLLFMAAFSLLRAEADKSGRAEVWLQISFDQVLIC